MVDMGHDQKIFMESVTKPQAHSQFHWHVAKIKKLFKIKISLTNISIFHCRKDDVVYHITFQCHWYTKYRMKFESVHFSIVSDNFTITKKNILSSYKIYFKLKLL